MRPEDIRECAEIIGAHPVIGPRYGMGMNDLRSAWLRLLGGEAMATAVYEEINGAATMTCGFGVGVFVREEFMREVKTPPLFWFGAELAKRIMAGSSPVLSDRDVLEANSGDGLNLIVWEALPRPEFAKRPDLYHLMVEAFLQLYRGFLLKEMITSQAESLQRLEWAVEAGGLLWNPAKARYMKSLPRNAEQLAQKPHVVGITREVEFGLLGSWVGTLFDYQAPQFSFSRREQRLLQAALFGNSGTDEELSEELDVSLPTVKKMWVSIYRRTDDRLPELNLNRSEEDVETIRRGKEKRRHLLTYLRKHPEELRPVSQKLLSQISAKERPSRKHLSP
jgi:hypothetical protein